MSDRFRITKAWAHRFAAEKIAVPSLLRRAGLPTSLFEQEKIHITTVELFALWRGVEEMCPEPGFGLRLGTELRFERSHPVAIAGVCSRSFDDALKRLARYKQLTCPEEIRVQRKGQHASVEIHFVEAREVQPDIMVDLGLSWILNVGRRGSDGEIAPMRLELTRPVRHRAMLESHFGCEARFKCDRNALIFRSSDLDRPFVTHNEELLSVLGAHLESELQTRDTGKQIGGQVKQILERLLAGSRPTLQSVAQELGMSARTLQRRLTDAGLTFQRLIEETRRELARHYLRQSTVELNDAAFLLGFKDANSFFRAFHGWEGTSPGEWRTRIREGK
jgi:AraC-like DNA-binding protein